LTETSYKQWNVQINQIIHNNFTKLINIKILLGVAWLSSIHVMKFLIKFKKWIKFLFNKTILKRSFYEASKKRATSNQHDLYNLGFLCVTIEITNRY